MNMREKIARAICKASGDDWDREGPEGLMQAYGQAADAVLDALMEPTEGMVKAGRAAIPYPDTIEAPFTAMIQAARDGA